MWGRGSLAEPVPLGDSSLYNVMKEYGTFFLKKTHFGEAAVSYGNRVQGRAL